MTAQLWITLVAVVVPNHCIRCHWLSLQPQF